MDRALKRTFCEHCPNFRSDGTFLPTLLTQRVDTEALVADAEARGWGEEAARHRRLIERLDRLIADAKTSSRHLAAGARGLVIVDDDAREEYERIAGRTAGGK
jgi:hypothetical protein